MSMTSLPSKKQQSGFTLLEMMIVLMIVAMIAPLMYNNYPQMLGERWSNLTIEQTMTIWDAARNYHVDHDEWPDEINDCKGAITVLETEGYLGGVPTTNAWSGEVTTSCTAGSAVMVIDHSVSETWVEYIVNNIGATQQIDDDKTRTFVPSPGTSVAFLNVLSRKAIPGQPDRNKMETDLDMGGNDINNVRNVNVKGVIHADSTDPDAESVIAHRLKAHEIYDSKIERYMAEMPAFKEIHNGTTLPWPSCPADMVGKGIAFPVSPCTASMSAEPIDRYHITYNNDPMAKSVQFLLSVHSDNEWHTPFDSCGNLFAAVTCDTP